MGVTPYNDPRLGVPACADVPAASAAKVAPDVIAHPISIVVAPPAPLLRFTPRCVPPSPRARILHTAERLFAGEGVRQVGLDAIARHAGVGRSEIGWHFADLDDLANEVLRAVARRSAIVRLDALRRREEEAAHENRIPALRDVIEIFCIPYFDPGTGPLLAQLVVGHQARPTPWSLAVIGDELDDMTRTFIAALGRAAPDLGHDALRWRYHFMVSCALLAAIEPGMPQRISRLASGDAPEVDAARMRRELVDFLVTGFSRNAEAPAL